MLAPPSVEIDVGVPAPNIAISGATGTTAGLQLPGLFQPKEPGVDGGVGARIPPTQVVCAAAGAAVAR